MKDFNYFFKRDGFDYDQPLLGQLHHGVVRGDVISGLLRNMNSVFVPMSRLEHSWPDNVRKDFVSHLQRYMASLTEMSNQAKGMTVLYIPQDDLSELDR